MSLIKVKSGQPLNYTNPIAAKLTQRRWQILVHSYLYYEVNTNIVADSQFNAWCQELVQLQSDFPDIARKCVYANVFEDFDGSTGFDLPYTNPDVIRKALLLLPEEMEDVEDGQDDERCLEPAREENSKITRRSLPGQFRGN